MNLRFVEAFYWVASLKSISRAAEKLFITQSAMSNRIATLESELGVLLLDRRDKSFRLTTAGKRFFSFAERLLDLQREAKFEMRGEPTQFEVSIRIGVIESVLHAWLIPWVALLRETFSGIQIELSVETTPTLIEQVRRGTVDIAFTALPAADDVVRSQSLSTMEMVFVGHTSLHKQTHYSLEQLSKYELLTFQRGSQPHVSLLDMLRQEKVRINHVHTIASISAMLQLVQSGFGIATVPRHVIPSKQFMPNLKILNTHTLLSALPIFLSYRPDPTTQIIESIVESALKFSEKWFINFKS